MPCRLLLTPMTGLRTKVINFVSDCYQMNKVHETESGIFQTLRACNRRKGFRASIKRHSVGL